VEFGVGGEVTAASMEVSCTKHFKAANFYSSFSHVMPFKQFALLFV
jgi:hypothetical protein